MKIENSFNIFEILGKDDKELIHSAFLKFLLEEDDKIWKDVFNYDNTQIKTIVLEKGFTVKVKGKTKRFRVDLIAKDGEGKRFIIENKFKSLPYVDQLKLYNNEFDQENDKKYLLSFDPNLITFNHQGWEFIGYAAILDYIKKNYIESSPKLQEEKALFIKHYYFFLKNHFEEYSRLKENCKPYFDRSICKTLARPEQKRNKFWLNIIYSIIRLELGESFKNEDIEVRFDISSGNAFKPLIDILPKTWDFPEKGIRFLIQVQGDIVKFYVHKTSNNVDHNFVGIIRETSLLNFPKNSFQFKNTYNKDQNSFYIFQMHLTQKFSKRDVVVHQEISSYIYQLYKDIDRKAIQMFK